MVFRNDVRTHGYGTMPLKCINLGLATSDDGMHWNVAEKPFIAQSDIETDEILRFYDPRLTVIDGVLHMCFAVDTKHGVHGGVGIIHDLERLEIMSKLPLIAPETDYEVDEGMRQNVIFPGGMILEDSGEVKIYYGASDTVECLATADVNDLIKLCVDKK